MPAVRPLGRAPDVGTVANSGSLGRQVAKGGAALDRDREGLAVEILEQNLGWRHIVRARLLRNA